MRSFWDLYVIGVWNVSNSEMSGFPTIKSFIWKIQCSPFNSTYKQKYFLTKNLHTKPSESNDPKTNTRIRPLWIFVQHEIVYSPQYTVLYDPMYPSVRPWWMAQLRWKPSDFTRKNRQIIPARNSGPTSTLKIGKLAGKRCEMHF